MSLIEQEIRLAAREHAVEAARVAKPAGGSLPCFAVNVQTTKQIPNFSRLASVSCLPSKVPGSHVVSVA